MTVHVITYVRYQPCRKCRTTEEPDTLCSRCGGHGMITGYMGDPDDCPDCGCSGMQWPARCKCGAYRAEVK